MKTIEELRKDKRINITEYAVGDGGAAFTIIPPEKKKIMIIFSVGDGWDHVSASYKNRCLTWDEMCRIKDIFFHEDEVVMQLHPTKKNYVNIHPYVLHLWKPQNVDIPLPQKIMV